MSSCAIYVPITMAREVQPSWTDDPLYGQNARNTFWLYVLGRLKRVIGVSQAESGNDGSWRVDRQGELQLRRVSNAAKIYPRGWQPGLWIYVRQP